PFPALFVPPGWGCFARLQRVLATSPAESPQRPGARPVEDDQTAADPESPAVLRQQIQQMQERLAFYEGFDALIQDNVTTARELFRLAAQERASASSDAALRTAATGDNHLRDELASISRELANLAASV